MRSETDALPEWAKKSTSVPILESSLIWTNKTVDLPTVIKGIADKLQKINFDKTAKEAAGNAATELKAEVKKEEIQIQKSQPEVPPAAVPVPAVAAPAFRFRPTPATAGKGPAERRRLCRLWLLLRYCSSADDPLRNAPGEAS